MSAAKVAISLPEELLQRVDALAAETGRSRSAVIKRSIENWLDALEEERAVTEARAIYAELEGDAGQRQLHASFAAVSYETVPPYDTHTEARRLRRRAIPQ